MPMPDIELLDVVIQGLCIIERIKERNRIVKLLRVIEEGYRIMPNMAAATAIRCAADQIEKE